MSVPCGTMPRMSATASSPPADYGQLLLEQQGQVRTSQASAMRAANAEMLNLYRTIGRALTECERDGWTTEAVQRIGTELRAQFPDMVALSPGNLDYMRRFAAAWPDPAGASDLAALPWGHIRVLLDELSDPQERDRYAVAAVRYGWSQNVLLHQIRQHTQHHGESSGG